MVLPWEFYAGLLICADAGFHTGLLSVTGKRKPDIVRSGKRIIHGNWIQPLGRAGIRRFMVTVTTVGRPVSVTGTSHRQALPFGWIKREKNVEVRFYFRFTKNECKRKSVSGI